MQGLRPGRLAERTNDHENTNGNLSKALSSDGRVMPRSATEGPRRSQAPPRSMQGSAAEKPLLRTRRDGRRDPKNRAELPTRSSNCACQQHALSGQLQRTEERSRRNSAVPAPVGPPLRSTLARPHRENSPSRHSRVAGLQHARPVRFAPARGRY
jgi:hypothetical protein